jgi:hypothetical protein
MKQSIHSHLQLKCNQVLYFEFNDATKIGALYYENIRWVACYPLFLFLILWRCRTISELMINEQIRDREVRLIGEDGEQLGVLPAKDAMKLA